MTTSMKGGLAGLLIIAGVAANPSQAARLGEPVADDAVARPHSAPAPAVRSSAGEIWSFHPQRDTFGTDALLDLRGLNELTAGQGGFVRLSADKK